MIACGDNQRIGVRLDAFADVPSRDLSLRAANLVAAPCHNEGVGYMLYTRYLSSRSVQTAVLYACLHAYMSTHPAARWFTPTPSAVAAAAATAAAEDDDNDDDDDDENVR